MRFCGAFAALKSGRLGKAFAVATAVRVTTPTQKSCKFFLFNQGVNPGYREPDATPWDVGFSVHELNIRVKIGSLRVSRFR